MSVMYNIVTLHINLIPLFSGPLRSRSRLIRINAGFFSYFFIRIKLHFLLSQKSPTGRPCDVYRVRSICFRWELLASLQFPRSIKTTKFEVNFYAKCQYNSFLPLLPIWKLALNVLASVTQCIRLSLLGDR